MLFASLFMGIRALFGGGLFNRCSGNNGCFGGCNGGSCNNNSIFDYGNKNDESLNVDCFETSNTSNKTNRKKSNKHEFDKIDNNKDFSKSQKEFLKLINNYRAKHGLRPLKLSKELCKGTQTHANWMRNNHSMTHAGNLQAVGRRGGYKGFVNTENIAAGQRNYKEAFKSWINSSGHRANILNANATDLGFASNGCYWSMNTGVSSINSL